MSNMTAGGVSSERRQEVDKPVVDLATGYLRPLLVISAPPSRRILRVLRREKARENCPLGGTLDQLLDLGVTRGIQAIGQGPSSENRRCMSMQR